MGPTGCAFTNASAALAIESAQRFAASRAAHQRPCSRLVDADNFIGQSGITCSEKSAHPAERFSAWQRFAFLTAALAFALHSSGVAFSVCGLSRGLGRSSSHAFV
jgi:hypothetical protein